MAFGQGMDVESGVWIMRVYERPALVQVASRDHTGTHSSRAAQVTDGTAESFYMSLARGELRWGGGGWTSYCTGAPGGAGMRFTGA